MKIRMFIAVWALLVAAVSESTPAEEAHLRSPWDAALPKMMLNEVSIAAPDLEGAWREMTARHLLRSVLVVDEAGSEAAPFSFSCESCTADELLGAFCEHYGYAWNVQPETSIIWLVPAAPGMERFLDARISIPVSLSAVPMHSGVMEPYVATESVFYLEDWTDQWLNLFDYPVNFDAGEYELKELLSRCLAIKPSVSFLLRRDSRDRMHIMAVPLPSARVERPMEGARLFWDLELGAKGWKAPSSENLIEILRSPSERIRWAGATYALMSLWTDHTLSPLVHHFESLKDEGDVRGLFTFLQSWMPRTINVTMPDGMRDAVKTLVQSKDFKGLPEDAQVKAFALALSQAATPEDEQELLEMQPQIGIQVLAEREIESFFRLHPKVRELLEQSEAPS